MYHKKIESFVCSETEPVVSTRAGRVRGYKSNDMYIFLGMRYAESERFTAPRPVTPWEGVEDAQDYGFICPYRHETVTKGNLAFPKRYWIENENCQYINVWTRSLDPSAKKPVILWLHGGGFASGSSIELECYDGENMALYGDVVACSLNHRLNLYGFLDLSDYGPEYELSGNAGMEDIVVALQWIHDNIAQFGGDPDNVTIFGESGGGAKVHTLMQMGAADGLYHRAIIDSGVMGGRDVTPEQQKQEAKELARSIVEAAGGLEGLKAASYEEVLRLLASNGAYMRLGPTPLTGSYVGDWHSVGFRSETIGVPMIVGSTFMELVPRPERINDKNALSEEERYAALVEAYGEGAPAIRDEFEKAYPGYNLFYASLVDTMVRRPTLEFCLKRVAAGGRDTFNFMFNFETGYRGSLPATHADELPFVFHNVEYQGSMFAGAQTLKTEEEIFSAFTTFARCGDPNNKYIGQWKRLTEEEHNCFVFDRHSSNRVAHDGKLIELVARYSKYTFPFFAKKPEKK